MTQSLFQVGYQYLNVNTEIKNTELEKKKPDDRCLTVRLMGGY
jgi:hypothetical protein